MFRLLRSATKINPFLQLRRNFSNAPKGRFEKFKESLKNIQNDPKKNFKWYHAAAIGALLYFSLSLGKKRNWISYNELILNYVMLDKVENIEIESYGSLGAVINFNLRDEGVKVKSLYASNLDSFLMTFEAFQKEKNKELIPVEYAKARDPIKTLDIVGSVIGVILSGGWLFLILRNSQKSKMVNPSDIMSIAESRGKWFELHSKVKTTFKDVAGLDEAKKEISEFVEFLKQPKKFQNLGARIPRGALLTGPPGTGKTLLAKACAGEAQVPFIYTSGSEFVEIFVGVGASRVRDLFSQAKKSSPCIIFIDEIDAVGKKRGSKMSKNDERDNTLNQLLVEMDGFGTDTQLIVIAASNRSELLDPALTRPGRFDRSIDVTLPDINGRYEILLVHLRKLKLNEEQSIYQYARRISTLTPGFSGADLANLVNEAAIFAARKDKESVDYEDFEKASERVMAGLEKKTLMTIEDKRKVAIHESGHAVAAWFLEGGNPVVKMSIIPRTKGSLGFTQYLPPEQSLQSKEELFDSILSILGGRVAEEIFYNEVSSGASDDLEKVYQYSQALVSKLGMTDKFDLSAPETENQEAFYRNYSEKTHEVLCSNTGNG